MTLKYKLFILFSTFLCYSLIAQPCTIKGTVAVNGAPIEFAQVMIDSIYLGAITNKQGKFTISDVPAGSYRISASYVGYAMVERVLTIGTNQTDQQLDFDLYEQSLQLDDIVVTGTKTSKRQTESPVIVNVINSETLTHVQACNLAEGLKFQPGLRVETDCQTCNYTQLRMNGLAGGY